MVGEGWLALAAELETDLRDVDPTAVVRPTIDASGLLRLDVMSERIPRRRARAEARRYEARASSICESCGGSIPHVRTGGGIVLVLCSDCSES